MYKLHIIHNGSYSLDYLKSFTPDEIELVEALPGDIPTDVDAYLVFDAGGYPPDIIQVLQQHPVIKIAHDEFQEHHVLRHWLLKYAHPIVSTPEIYEFVDWRFDNPLHACPPLIDLTPFSAVAKHNHRSGAVWINNMTPAHGLPRATQWANEQGIPIEFYGAGPSRPQDGTYKGNIDIKSLPELLAQKQYFVYMPEQADISGHQVVAAYEAGCELVLNRNVSVLYWLEKNPAALRSACFMFWQFVSRILAANVYKCNRCDGNNWNSTGLIQEGKMLLPCRNTHCQAAMVIDMQTQQMHVEPTGFPMPYTIEDEDNGGVSKLVYWEIQQNYKFDEIAFKPGDVVIDIGAQVGVVAIHLAKQYPDIHIYAFEPVPTNYQRLLKNLKDNGVENVTAINKAVTSDGRPVTLNGNLKLNSGNMSIYAQSAASTYEAESITLDAVFERYKLSDVALLKVDCEGAEYEILNNTRSDNLAKIKHVRGEWHMNQTLAQQGHDPNKLSEYLKQHITDVQASVVPIGD